MLKQIIDQLYAKEKQFVYGRYSAQRDECVSNQDRIFNLESAGMIDIAPKEIVWPQQ